MGWKRYKKHLLAATGILAFVPGVAPLAWKGITTLGGGIGSAAEWATGPTTGIGMLWSALFGGGEGGEGEEGKAFDFRKLISGQWDPVLKKQLDDSEVAGRMQGKQFPGPSSTTMSSPSSAATAIVPPKKTKGEIANLIGNPLFLLFVGGSFLVVVMMMRRR